MGFVDKVVKNLRHPKKPFNLPLPQICGPHDELLFHGLFCIFSSFKAYCTPAKAQTSESLHAYAWGCKYPVLQKMIWSLPGVCRNLKQWSTVVKSPCACVSSFREFYCWIPKEANKHLSAFPFRYFNRKHNTRGIPSNWKFISAAKCSSFNGLGREVRPYKGWPGDLHFTQDIVQWNGMTTFL